MCNNNVCSKDARQRPSSSWTLSSLCSAASEYSEEPDSAASRDQPSRDPERSSSSLPTLRRSRDHSHPYTRFRKSTPRAAHTLTNMLSISPVASNPPFPRLRGEDGLPLLMPCAHKEGSFINELSSCHNVTARTHASNALLQCLVQMLYDERKAEDMVTTFKIKKAIEQGANGGMLVRDLPLRAFLKMNQDEAATKPCLMPVRCP